MPSLGIFWLLPDGFLWESTSMAEAERYGDLMIAKHDHYSHWMSISRAMPRGDPRRKYVSEFEYEYWPRGRVSYNCKLSIYILLADAKIIKDDSSVLSLLSIFDLPSDRTAIQHDSHYVTGRLARF